MRILWVHNFSPAGISSGIFMHILHDRLRDMGADITMHYTGSLRGVGRILASAWRVRRLSKQFDLVHAQYGSACGYVCSFAVGRKMLWLRGTDLLGMDVGGMLDLAHGVCNRWLTRHSLRSYDKIVVVSHRMKEDVLQLCPNADVEVLPSGVNLQKFRPMDRQEARRQLGEGDDQSPWILFSSVAGAARPIKRVPLGLETVRLVQAHRADVKLKFITGQTHDRIPLWVNACDVVLLTSHREGWPNIIKESLACHVPFVSTDVSDLRSIAAQEESCMVVDSTPEALSRGILAVLKFGRTASLRRHVEPMEINVIGARLLKIYEWLCATST